MEASCSCVCKFLSLVSSYLPLESQRNAGWKGPPEPSPSWKQGCLHRGTWLLSDTSWRGKKPLRMEIHKLSASWGSRALSFSLQAFSPYSLPEFPRYNFCSYYIFPITIYPIDRIENVSVFMNLFTWQFFSLLREVTFRVVTHLCSNQGLSCTRYVYTRDQSDSTVFPRMQEKHVSAVQVKRRAQLLLVLCLLHRYFPFPHFPPNISNWFLFVCIKQNVIP